MPECAFFSFLSGRIVLTGLGWAERVLGFVDSRYDLSAQCFLKSSFCFVTWSGFLQIALDLVLVFALLFPAPNLLYCLVELGQYEGLLWM